MDALPVYNILLLGPTQSGKSTFLENVKQYANPSYIINTSRIGNGNESCTQVSHVEVVTTNLPNYQLFEDDKEFDACRLKDENSFRRFLARDGDLELRRVDLPRMTPVQFRIFDTPGLNDTNDNDIQNIASTFSSLIQVDYFHLIIITDSHHVPLNPSQKEAFRTYFDLFDDLKGLITIVHTHAPNQYRIPGINTRLDNKLKERSEFFNGIVGRVVPTKRIDCNPDETGPAHMCMTRNAIREILEMATIKAPVAIDATRVRKVKTMLNVDKLAYDAFKIKLDSDLASCQSNSEKLTVEIEDIEKNIEAKKEVIAQHDTDELLPIYEERYDEGVNFFSWFQDLGGRAEREHTMDFREQEFVIDNVRIAQQAISILNESGGKGEKSWKVKFKRYKFNAGYYHAVLSTFKRTKHEKDIKQWNSELEELNKALKDKQEEQKGLKEAADLAFRDPWENNDLSDSFEQLRKRIIDYRRMLDITSDRTLPVDLFLELAEAEVYHPSNIVASDKALDKHFEVVKAHCTKRIAKYGTTGLQRRMVEGSVQDGDGSRALMLGLAFSGAFYLLYMYIVTFTFG
ncbi:hypothetical protein B0O80DRAFT_459351 [Mortierella sp. GBAus27b]|nr:hypothetical protein B0O80DRAFT_459351 [Mortierella sp. GBAus27b]